MSKKTNKSTVTDPKTIKVRNVESFNMDSYNEEMEKVRRDFIQKSTSSKKSASELILTS